MQNFAHIHCISHKAGKFYCIDKSAFSRGNLTFLRFQKLSRTNRIKDKRKHRKCEHFLVTEMFKLSFTSFHVLSLPLCKTCDSFVVWKILACFLNFDF